MSPPPYNYSIPNIQSKVIRIAIIMEIHPRVPFFIVAPPPGDFPFAIPDNLFSSSNFLISSVPCFETAPDV